MRLLYVTDSEYNFNILKEYLAQFEDIELVDPNSLGLKVNIDNSSKNEEEVSSSLAKTYYELTKLPTLVDISGLYIDRFRDNEQPGIDINNYSKNGSNEMIIDNFINLLMLRGGRSLAHYVKGICYIDENGEISKDTYEEKEFLLTSKKCEKTRYNAGIECISYDLDAQKYFNERNKEEEADFYKELFAKFEKMLHNSALTNARGK